MNDELPRTLPERTGVHRCVRCLRPTPADEYFEFDYLCRPCAAEDGFPLASTPDSGRDGEQ